MPPRDTPTIKKEESSFEKYEQDGDAAKEIAKYLPYFPFKGIPRFYDIGGFLDEPEIFQRIVDIFVARYESIGIDRVAGYVQRYDDFLSGKKKLRMCLFLVESHQLSFFSSLLVSLTPFSVWMLVVSF